MDDREGELRVQRWSALLLVVGMLGLLPFPPIRGAFELAEESLLTARRWLSRGVGSGAPLGDAAALGRPDPRVVELLSRARAALLPPRSAGWQRDGDFGVVPVGRERRPDMLSLVVAGSVPAGEPAFAGRVLIGTTAVDPRTQRPYVRPLLAKGTRLPACAGVPGRRGSYRGGDGTETLRAAPRRAADPRGRPRLGSTAPARSAVRSRQTRRASFPSSAARSSAASRAALCRPARCATTGASAPPSTSTAGRGGDPISARPAGTGRPRLAPLVVHPTGAAVRDGLHRRGGGSASDASSASCPAAW
jgi:hypothetical protein